MSLQNQHRNISFTEAMKTNMVQKITQDNLWKLLEWLLFITLCIDRIGYGKSPSGGQIFALTCFAVCTALCTYEEGFCEI